MTARRLRFKFASHVSRPWYHRDITFTMARSLRPQFLTTTTKRRRPFDDVISAWRNINGNVRSQHYFRLIFGAAPRQAARWKMMQGHGQKCHFYRLFFLRAPHAEQA